MRNHKKLVQREEVRKILHAMRLELAAQAAASAYGGAKKPITSISEILRSGQRG